MPIIVDGSTTSTPTASVDTGQISFLRAKQIVARSVGDQADQALLDEAGDLLLMALEELSLHNWDFLRRTETLSLTQALGADYELDATHKKVYDVRLSTANRPLTYIDQRAYDRATYSQTAGTPTHYTIFPGSAVEAADPQHSVSTIRFIPPPSSAATAVVKYYRQMAIVDDDGDILDLPRKYQYWPIQQAKAWILADHDGTDSRVQYWQQLADRLLSRMKAEDQDQPDEDLGFQSSQDQVGAFDRTHPYAALAEIDGF